jgi:hypothetical protein
MKRTAIILTVFVCLAAPPVVHAGPFLVCDPVTEPVEWYEVTMNGITAQVPATKNQDGTVQLRYDLKDLPKGSYEVKAVAISYTWADRSEPSLPFVFSRLQPSKPSSFRLER